MHHIFYIAELVFAILNHLPKREQLRFGLTCKTVWNASVSRIWRVVGTHYQTHLVFCCLLPTDLAIRTFADIAKFRKGSVLREIKHTELAPFLKYGKYIHYLGVRESGALGLVRHTLSALARVRGGLAAVLPNLHSLELDLASRDPKSVDGYVALLTLHVKRLTLHTGKVDIKTLATPLFETLELRRGLQTFCVWLGQSDPANASASDCAELAKLITHLRGLKMLAIEQAADPGVCIPSCALLPNLEELCYVDRDLPSLSTMLPSYPKGFPCLKALRLKLSSQVIQLDRLCLSISSMSLAEMHIGYSDIEVIARVVCIIGDRWSRSLSALHLDIDRPQGTSWLVNRTREVSMETFQPLLRCHGLRQVEVAFEGIVTPTDVDVDAMSSAWPHLRYLAFKCRSSRWVGEPRPTATCRSLVFLSRRCLSLLHVALTIHFKFPSSPSPPSHGEADPSAARVKCLNCLSSESSLSPPVVSAFLRNTFPLLEAFGSHNYDLNKVAVSMGLTLMETYSYGYEAIVPTVDQSNRATTRKRQIY